MILKTILDYYDQICLQYPNIPISDIKRILLYGYKSLYIHNNYGGDVLLNLKGFWFYTGQLTNDSLKHFNYYKKKMRLKLRIMYNRKHIKWDGYYYFALSQNQYNDYLSQINKRGRPKKIFNFSKIILYKIYDECNIAESSKVALFRVSLPIERGFSIYKESMTTDLAEFLFIRKPLKLKDILLSQYNYQFISKHNKYE